MRSENGIDRHNQPLLPSDRPPTRRASLSWLAPLLAVTIALSAGLVSACPWPPPSEPVTDDPSGPSFAELWDQPAAAELPGRLVIYFLDVGQGDAIYLRTPEGKVALIDAGDDPDQVADFLAAKGVERVDLLALSHPHADHIGGALALLDRFEVGTLCLTGVVHTSQVYEDLLERAVDLAEAGALDQVMARAGDLIQLDPALSLTVLHPAEPPEADDLNDTSLVLRLVHGEFAALFPGDLELAGEAAVLGRVTSSAELGADVLKVAHHGSASSTGAAFLAAVDPALAVISVGADNRYGHPSQEVIDRLTLAGVEVHLTMDQGTIIIYSDGTTWTVVTER